ncbi:unnamed protein product [Dovyalis caffra]|uniref:Uncharacterized protein n=1 Tax=Dovyalis caffra TaxID=77055 RepID=A0AAV1QWP3_9ROSI|nr:unnamed protein product [Dovyalis caffra]
MTTDKRKDLEAPLLTETTNRNLYRKTAFNKSTGLRTLGFARPVNNMTPTSGADKVYLPQGNRPIVPSGPNGCTYLPTPPGAPGHCRLHH